MLSLEMCCATDIGVVRKTNQDSVAVFPKLNMVVLADGMGGHLAGEVASRRAIEVVRDRVSAGERIEKAVTRANADVFAMGTQRLEYSGMGTTLVLAQYDGLKAKILNVGDSRLYRFRKNTLMQLTVDQTVAQELRAQGLEHRDGRHISTFEHVLTNALGIQAQCVITVTNDIIQPGDIHLLCSDGLTGVLDDSAISKLLAEHTQQRVGPLEGAVRALFNAALLRSAPDNVSVALVKFRISAARI
jgi:serine/threonine protein phosphatase PrpC